MRVREQLCPKCGRPAPPIQEDPSVHVCKEHGHFWLKPGHDPTVCGSSRWRFEEGP